MKIKMNSLYIGIALMCMMLPASLKSLPFGIEITVLAMVVCIVAFFLEFERIHMCPTLLLLIVLALLELTSTIFNDGNAFVCIKNIITYIALYYLTIGELSKNEKAFLKVALLVFEIYIYIEIVSIILGMDFLGNYNQIYMIFPCFTAMTLLLRNQTGRKKYTRKFWSTSIIVIFGCFLSQIIYGTRDLEATFLISAGILILYAIFSQFFEKISMKMCLIGILFINVTLVITQSLLNNSVIEYIIQNVLHKSLNLTGRTDLWKMSVYTIIQKPIWGYGVSWEGLSIWGGKFVQHNQFLYLACVGGLLLVLCLVVWLVYIAYKGDQYSKNDIVFKICQYTLLSQLVLFLTLSYSIEQLVPFLFVMDVASYYVERQLGKSKIKKNRKLKIIKRN